jgi:hypothetical protein
MIYKTSKAAKDFFDSLLLFLLKGKGIREKIVHLKL